MEQIVAEKDRAAALQAFEQIGHGEQAQIVYMEPDEEDEGSR